MHRQILVAVEEVCTERIPRFIGGAQYWRKGSHALRSHRSWKTRLFSHTSRTVTERQTLDSSFECWWASETSLRESLDGRRALIVSLSQASLSPWRTWSVFQMRRALVLDWNSSSWQSQGLKQKSQLAFSVVVGLRLYFRTVKFCRIIAKFEDLCLVHIFE